MNVPTEARDRHQRTKMPRTRRVLRGLGALLVLLLLLRLVLPFGVAWYVNHKLDESPNYEGQVGDVDIHLYRGAYSIDDVTITKVEGMVPVPFFATDRVEFSLLWSALLRGSLVSSIVFERPTINIVDSDREENKQTGTDRRWFALLDDLAPLRIDEVRIHDGELHFRNFDVVQDVDVYITDFEGVASNLTNSAELSESMVGRISGRGKVTDAGDLEFSVAYDPESEQPTFDFDGRVDQVPLTRLDALIDAYAPFDIEAGMLSLTTELAAADGNLSGYVKPLITELAVFEWRSDVMEDKDNPLQVAWEALVGIVTELLENQSRDQLATVVELNGRIDDPETNKWMAFINILRNAFIEALGPDFEDSIDLDRLNERQDVPVVAPEVRESGE